MPPLKKTPASEAEERKRRIAQAVKDFPRFCGLLQIRPKRAGVDGEGSRREQMRLTNIQRRYNAARTSRDIVLKPRQIYFTTLEAARDLWWFLNKHGARVVVVCQSQTDQAALKDLAEKFRIFFDSLRRVGVEMKMGRDATTEWSIPSRDATMRIIQAGASEASAGKKGRGGTVNRLHFTEAAFFERAEDTFNSIMESVPRLGSEVVVESTPNGVGGFYHAQWQAAVSGESAYKPHFFRWWDHPDYFIPLGKSETFEPRTQLEAELLKRGVPAGNLAWYRWKIADKGGNAKLVAQEYPSDPESCFLLSGTCFFDVERVQLGITRAAPPIAVEMHGALRIWEQPKPDSKYVVGADPSEGGESGDPAAAIVVERGTGRHVATLHGHHIPWEFARLLARVGEKYNLASIAPERNNHGHAVIQALRNVEKYKRLYVHTDSKIGWLTNEASRAQMLDSLDAAHRRDEWETPDVALLGEMRTFTIGPTGKAEASKGCHDDRVMAAAIARAVAIRAERPSTTGEVTQGTSLEDREVGI